MIHERRKHKRKNTVNDEISSFIDDEALFYPFLNIFNLFFTVAIFLNLYLDLVAKALLL